MGRLLAKLLVALVAAGVSGLLGLQARGVISLPRDQVAAMVVATALLAAGSSAAAAISEWRQRREGARAADTEVVLAATLWAVVDLVRLDYRDLGLAVYRVGRDRAPPWRRRLVRVHRVRARRRPAASRVRWAPGKGVIGLCVARGQVVAQDLRAAYAAMGPVTREEWDLLPADVRLGLSFDELLDVREKYDVVVATPVIDDVGQRSRVVGCVALDGPAGTLDDLGGDDVLGLLDSAGLTCCVRAGEDYDGRQTLLEGGTLMSPNVVDALRRSLLVKQVVHSPEGGRRLAASLRRLGADERTIAAAAGAHSPTT